MPDHLEHVLGYAGLGLEIFPVGGDKAPLISQHKATTDLDQLQAWWAQWPEALIGHRIAPDVVLLDIDPRHGGKATWKAIRGHPDYNGAQPRTHFSGRGDGGGHVWFFRPSGELTIAKLNKWAREQGIGTPVLDKDGNEARWISGIDILHHDHRYTILPPSLHPETQRPYHWAKGRGLNARPSPLPPFLVELLTKDPPKPPPVGPAFKTADSIADWFSESYGWHDVLVPHGWVCVEGDGEANGSAWQHPQATTSHSATISHRQLFVYSTSTVFEPTESGEAHGYTPFRAWALLNHSGDLSKAAKAARELKRSQEDHGVASATTSNGADPLDGGQGADQGPTAAPGTLQTVDLASHEAFWELEPILGRIRDFARARRCSPWAMLGVVLCRVAAATPPFVVLPPLVGSQMGLNLYTVLVGGSGSGKDAAISAGKDCLDVSQGIDFRQIGLGSGEGILDQFVEFMPADKAKGEDARIEQHSTSVLFTNPEIETVSALKGRSGATLMPMLRDAWMGSGLGFAYANQQRRLYIIEHAYRLGLILGCQPTSAGVLLDESCVGTPQRFLWLPVHDPMAPDKAPPAPEMGPWRLPQWHMARNGKVEIGLCEEAWEAIDNGRLERLRGTQAPDSPDGHSLAAREKVGAILAILLGRTAVDSHIWSMAGVVATVSQQTREDAAAVIAGEARRRNVAQGEAEGHRQDVVADVLAEKAIRRVVASLNGKISFDWVTRADLRKRVTSRDRKYFDDAIERLVADGVIETEEVSYRGQVGLKIRKI